jgi:hypothetical protein
LLRGRFCLLLGEEIRRLDRSFPVRRVPRTVGPEKRPQQSD